MTQPTSGGGLGRPGLGCGQREGLWEPRAWAPPPARADRAVEQGPCCPGQEEACPLGSGPAGGGMVRGPAGPCGMGGGGQASRGWVCRPAPLPGL